MTFSLWQLALLFTVAALFGAVVLSAAVKRQLWRRAVKAVCDEVEKLGHELRRNGYLHRGRLVEAAQETVRAWTDGRPVPDLVRPGGEEPVDRYIRECKGRRKALIAKAAKEVVI